MTAPMIRAAARARSVLCLVLLAVSTASLTAAADEPVYPPAGAYPVTRLVKFDDLDLNSTADAKKLYRRLQAAVRTVCDARRSYPPEYIKTTIRPCVRMSLNSAVREVNAPLVTAHHRKQSGGTEPDTAVAAER